MQHDPLRYHEPQPQTSTKDTNDLRHQRQAAQKRRQASMHDNIASAEEAIGCNHWDHRTGHAEYISAFRAEESNAVEGWEGKHHAGSAGMSTLGIPQNQRKQTRSPQSFDDKPEDIHDGVVSPTIE